VCRDKNETRFCGRMLIFELIQIVMKVMWGKFIIGRGVKACIESFKVSLKLIA